MAEIIGRADLIAQLRRFAKDRHRGIPLELFCELAGIDREYLWSILFRDYVMTERVQIRLSKTFTAWKNGEIAVYRNRNRSVTAKYRTKPQQYLRRSLALRFSPDKGISLDARPRLRGDYTKPTLFED